MISFAIHIPSLVKCQFQSFILFLIDYLVFIAKLRAFFINFEFKSTVDCVTAFGLSYSVACLFIPFFIEQKFLTLMKSSL
jgi:hypothetical protein